MSAFYYPIEDIFPDIRLFAPNVSDPVCARFAIESARRFCTVTAAWILSDKIKVEDSQDKCIAVCLWQDAAIERIDRGRLKDRELLPVTRYWLDENLPDWESEKQRGTACYITQLSEDTVRIIPGQTGDLFLRIIAKPSLKAETFPAFLMENYREIIARQAAGLLMLTPAPDTANPNLGSALLQEAQQKQADLRWRIYQTQIGAPLRVEAQWF